jgi:predicted dinucleotide-binding enzyme
MAQLALTLEATLRHPVDVDGAYAGGGVVFVAVPADYNAVAAAQVVAELC